MMFTAYNTTQTLETSVNATLGYMVLGALYSCFALSVFFAGKIVNHIGEK
jgi:hypothetical protein